jgi:hypothetical protein
MGSSTALHTDIFGSATAPTPPLPSAPTPPPKTAVGRKRQHRPIRVVVSSSLVQNTILRYKLYLQSIFKYKYKDK